MAIVEIGNVNFCYGNTGAKALSDITLAIERGECLVLCGESGCGKTSLTRLINGLIPHYYEGELSGRVTVGGIETGKAELFETAHLVGSVFQNPRSQFFCVDTTGEIAFGCENMGLPAEVIERRVEEAASSLSIEYLLGRNIFKLSGGEKQRVACASVSALHPDILVLDEPTSNLDMDAIHDLKNVLLFWKQQGKTVIIAEHRLHWLMDVCDRYVYMKGGRIVSDSSIKELASLPSATVRAMGLRALSLRDVDAAAPEYGSSDSLYLSDYYFSYKQNSALNALNIPSLSLPTNAVIALIGRNGAGKSTFTHCLCGLQRKFRGSADFLGQSQKGRQMLKKCYVVMQDVNHQLFCESVADEIRLGMSCENEALTKDVVARLGLKELLDRHPMSLSGGQKQKVAVAAALLADKQILVFDEPTSGLDFKNMEQLSALISSLQGEKTVFIVTHDPELIIRCCTHVLRLEAGEAQECYALAGHESQLLASFISPEAANHRPSINNRPSHRQGGDEFENAI